MKRSEMLEKLARSLEVYHGDYYLSPKVDSGIAADCILGFLENRGMLPPCIGIYGNDGMTSNLYTYDCFNGGNYDSVELEDFCKWEPEDD